MTVYGGGFLDRHLPLKWVIFRLSKSVTGRAIVGHDLPAFQVFEIRRGDGEELSFAEDGVGRSFEFFQQKSDHTSFTPYSLR